jgi:hypothetical protein
MQSEGLLPVWIQLWVLAIAKIYFKLLLCSRIEAEVGLVREIVRVELHFDKASLGDESLWLFNLTTKHSRVSAVTDLSLGVAINDLKTKTNKLLVIFFTALAPGTRSSYEWPPLFCSLMMYIFPLIQVLI